jgi:Tfp pilus assembly protein PilN
VDERSAEMEVYGESEARPVFSATFDAPNPQLSSRALALALSELRLPADAQPRTIAAVLPAPVAKPETLDLNAVSLPYATALAGACPRLTLRANLLPPELRVTSSRAMYIPSIVLGALLLLSLGGLALYGSWEDRNYRNAVQAEIARIEPVASRPMALDRQINATRQRTMLLDSFRKRTQADLDALNELTKLLPPPGWLMAAEIQRDQVRVNGEAEQAAGLLRVLDQSPLFEAADFAMPLARSAIGDTFSIRARREGVLP